MAKESKILLSTHVDPSIEKALREWERRRRNLRIKIVLGLIVVVIVIIVISRFVIINNEEPQNKTDNTTKVYSATSKAISVNGKTTESSQNSSTLATKKLSGKFTTTNFESTSPTSNILHIEGPDYDNSDSNSDFSEEISIFARHQNFENFPKKMEIYKKSETRIQHGGKAELFEFPWMVSMMARNVTSDSENHYCGASLVSERIILTAAHCVKIDEALEISLILGEYNTTTNPDCQTLDDKEECADEVLKISRSNFTIIPHPNYSNITAVNDIAIIKLKHPVESSRSISPILLPWNQPEIPQQLQIIGFGKTHRWWEGSPSEVLMKASLKLVDKKNCTEAYNNSEGFKISESSFCAADMKYYKKIEKEFMIGTCEGDSGSSIFEYSTQKEKIIQYGVTSWGDSDTCGFKNRPGVFTKVYDYLKWILDESGE